MQALNYSNNELENELEELLKDCEEIEESKFPRRRLNKKWSTVPELVDKDEEDLDDFVEPRAYFNDKVANKRQRDKKDESGLEKKQDSVCDYLEISTEINEMWDSITNNKSYKKDDYDYEIERLFKMRRKKRKKNAVEIALQVEQVMANLEIAVEDDVELNKEGKPAISKFMKLPLLTGALSKQLQGEFLDHGVLNLLKKWLEPLPDGSLPNINIRTAVLKILNDLRINLGQDCRREQLIKSGIGMAIIFLSKSPEETVSNRRLASDLVNKWGRGIYNKSTRYENICSQEEREEQHQILLRRQNKTAPMLPEPKPRDFDVDVDLHGPPKCKLAPSRVLERAKIPTAISMDFVIRPESKVDRELESRVQIDRSCIHENIIKKMQKKTALRRKKLQAARISADGRTMPKY